jgi:[protein-PII] uridylyltransferase
MKLFTSMTKWKRHMLDDLFRVTDEVLSRPFSAETVEDDAAADSKRLSRVWAAVRAQWDSTEDAAFLDEYLRSMPQGYLLSNSPEAIAWHARVARRAQAGVVLAEIVPSRRQDVTALCIATADRVEDPLCVVAKDRPGLLASIAAAITASGFDVHAAQVHTRHLSEGRVQAVDLFWVTARDRVEDLEVALVKLRQDLERVVTGAVAASDLIRNARRTRFSDRPVPAVATEVVVDNRASGTHTMVEVVTRDRPGLLFTLARTFQELDLSINVAKINTEGTRVLDVFYVTDLNGHKLDGNAPGERLRSSLLGALGVPSREPLSLRADEQSPANASGARTR